MKNNQKNNQILTILNCSVLSSIDCISCAQIIIILSLSHLHCVNFPSLKTSGGEGLAMEPLQDAGRRPPEAEIWSGSYGLCAKVNQFEKNLGPPAPGGVPVFARQLLAEYTRIDLWRKTKTKFQKLILLVFWNPCSCGSFIWRYLKWFPCLLATGGKQVLWRFPTDPGWGPLRRTFMIRIIWATRKS